MKDFNPDMDDSSTEIDYGFNGKSVWYYHDSRIFVSNEYRQLAQDKTLASTDGDIIDIKFNGYTKIGSLSIRGEESEIVKFYMLE